MRYRDFEVAIVGDDDKNFQEYNIEVDDTNNRISCWVASEAGKPFSMKFTPTKPQDYEMSARPSLDGMDAHGWQYEVGQMDTRFVKGIETSMTTMRRFTFSALRTTDDDNFLSHSSAKNIGEILVEIWQILIGNRVSTTFRSPQDHQVHERSKKAISHSVGYGESQYHAFEGFSRSSTDIRKISTFIFRYRPLDFLQAEGIAPPPEPRDVSSTARKRRRHDAGPTVAGSSTDAGGSNPAEDEARVKELLAELSTLQSRLTGNNSNKRVKTENWPTIVPNKVIDLTNDSMVKEGHNAHHESISHSIIDLTDD